MRSYHRELIREARALGLEHIAISHRGQRHPRLTATLDGKSVCLVVAGTPGERRAVLNAIAALRRHVRRRRR